MDEIAPGGLRQRKKERTRTLLREHALRLFLEQGYEATTVEEIADAAEVSPSTFFRYFRAKEDVIFYDPYDEVIAQSLAMQAADTNPIQAIRCALKAAFADASPEQREFERRKHRLIASTPSLRARDTGDLIGNMEFLAQYLAQRLSLPTDSLRVRTLAGALVGVLISATAKAHEDPGSDPWILLDASLTQFEFELASPLRRSESTPTE